MNRCQHCGGAIYHDGEDLRCLNCARAVVVLEPLPYQGRAKPNTHLTGKCADCGEPVDYRSKRCAPCYRTSKAKQGVLL